MNSNLRVLIVGAILIAVAIGALAWYKSRTSEEAAPTQQSGQSGWTDPYKNLQIPQK